MSTGPRVEGVERCEATGEGGLCPASAVAGPWPSVTAAAAAAAAPTCAAWALPCTFVMPYCLPESSLVAKFPSVATSFGWISEIWRKR